MIRPETWVVEQVETSLGESHKRRAKTRRVLGTVSLRLHEGSRGFALGSLNRCSGCTGIIPITRAYSFSTTDGKSSSDVRPPGETPPRTRLCIEREVPTPGPVDGEIGFSVTEMTNADRTLPSRHWANA